MPRPRPPKELIDKMAATYNAGKSVREVATLVGVSYGTAHLYLSKHPNVTMRGYDGKPRRARPTERTV